MNRTDLKARIRDAINDPSSVILTDTQLNDLIDEAGEFVVGETRSIKRSAFLALREGTTFYSTRSLAPDMMLPYRIWLHDGATRLTVTSMDELDQFQHHWLDTTGTPEMWFPVSWDMIGVWPKSVASGSVLRVDYFAWPRLLLDDDDESELMVATQNALVLYGTYMGLLKLWDAERAVNVFKALKGVDDFAKARSGILKVGHRSFGRSDLSLPHTIRSEE